MRPILILLIGMVGMGIASCHVGTNRSLATCLAPPCLAPRPDGLAAFATYHRQPFFHVKSVDAFVAATKQFFNARQHWHWTCFMDAQDTDLECPLREPPPLPLDADDYACKTWTATTRVDDDPVVCTAFGHVHKYRRVHYDLDCAYM